MRLRTRLASLAALMGAVACNGDDGTPIDTAPTDPGPVEVIDLLPQTIYDPIEIIVVLDTNWNEGISALEPQLLENVFETLLLADTAWRMTIMDANATGSSFGLMGPKLETFPLQNNVFQPPPGGGTPKFREAIYTALELRREQDANTGFLRGDSDLYIFVYTNKEDATDDLDEGISRRAFQTWLESFERSNSVRLGAFTTAERAEYWADHTYGGRVFEAGSFRRGLEVMFRDAIGQKTEFVLSYPPIEPPTVVDVIYRDHRTEYFVDQDFTYDPETRTVAFLQVVPRTDSVVRVIYETEGAVEEAAVETETEETTATPAR